MFELTAKKQEVLVATGNLLVMGGPGSGKTTIALVKANHDISKGVLKKEQKILFLSFARATVSRVEQHAKDVLKECDTSALEIATYHSFIWTIMKSHGYLLVKHKIRLLPPHDAYVRLSTIDDKDKRDAEKIRLFSNEGLLHFDLFAKSCLKLLSGSKTLSSIISNTYPIIILDEFQDTNEDEWALIAHLGKNSTLIALADPEQRIYDFRGADPARIRQFIEVFNPKEFDFGTENNRSNGTDIVEFGNDLLVGRNKGKTYKDVYIYKYPFRRGNVQLCTLKSHLIKRLNAERDNKNWSLAILVPSNRLMMTVSDFLGKRNLFSDGKTMPAIFHEVSVDVAGPTIAATFIARLLELASQKKCSMEIVVAELCEHILGHRGDKGVSKGDQDTTRALMDYVTASNYERLIRGKLRQLVICECKRIADICNDLQFTGEVAVDWVKVRQTLNSATSDYLRKLHDDAMFIKLLRKGSLLNNSLAEIWRINGNYNGALDAVKRALTQEHFATSTKTWSGINIMTIHKAKGKEFDEVIVYEGAFDGQRYIAHNDLDKAKLVLRVAVTRAKSKTIIFTPENAPCTLL